MKQIIIPNTNKNTINNSVVFLAGSIREEDDWQEKAITFLLGKNPSLIIASPKKIIGKTMKGDDKPFPRQRACVII